MVTVLTKPHERDRIRAAIAADSSLSGLEVIFVGDNLPQWMTDYRVLLQFYYPAWQLLALRAARPLHADRRFDVVHAITTSGIRFPCFLGRLGIPFIIGPLGGGELMPRQVRRKLPPYHRMLEHLRELTTLLLPLDPFMRDTFTRAQIIFVRTPETGSAIGLRHGAKIRQCFGIGIEPESIVAAPRTANRGSAGTFGVLFVARLIYWKGGELVLACFEQLLRRVPEARLTIIGRGPELAPLQRRAAERALTDRIVWRDDWISVDVLQAQYATNQVLLFPSLHEAGGTVVLEAIANAMPVVCLNVGGPGQIVGQKLGAAIATEGVTVTVIVDRLAAALEGLARDAPRYAAISEAAWSEAWRRGWRSEVECVYSSLTEGWSGA